MQGDHRTLHHPQPNIIHHILVCATFHLPTWSAADTSADAYVNRPLAKILHKDCSHQHDMKRDNDRSESGDVIEWFHIFATVFRIEKSWHWRVKQWRRANSRWSETMRCGGQFRRLARDADVRSSLNRHFSAFTPCNPFPSLETATIFD